MSHRRYFHLVARLVGHSKPPITTCTVYLSTSDYISRYAHAHHTHQCMQWHRLSFVSEATTCHYALSHPTTPNVFKGFSVSNNKTIPKRLGFLQHTDSGKAIDSKLPLRPPRALNCGMALKRQEMDHSKRKTKVPMMPIWKGWEWGRFWPPGGSIGRELEVCQIIAAK